ncbi:hypothetical protein [Psychrobacter lutiphocae]|uniref:hypothetical protein n=1 Tax=Psychrobacter lutiphocae TaxID=540500 RepID=UPI0003606FEE|nr:hypothetical protein [Psychrobacter lutiphocae]
MKNVLMISALTIGCLFALPVQAAEQSTKVTFADGSYCGSFSGNMKDGKKFRLWLQPNQELVIRNTGNDQLNVAYVEGPSGRLEGARDCYEDRTTYYTESKGNHYMKVYGNDSYSSVEFCAY